MAGFFKRPRLHPLDWSLLKETDHRPFCPNIFSQYVKSFFPAQKGAPPGETSAPRMAQTIAIEPRVDDDERAAFRRAVRLFSR